MNIGFCTSTDTQKVRDHVQENASIVLKYSHKDGMKVLESTRATFRPRNLQDNAERSACVSRQCTLPCSALRGQCMLPVALKPQIPLPQHISGCRLYHERSASGLMRVVFARWAVSKFAAALDLKQLRFLDAVWMLCSMVPRSCMFAMSHEDNMITYSIDHEYRTGAVDLAAMGARITGGGGGGMRASVKDVLIGAVPDRGGRAEGREAAALANMPQWAPRRGPPAGKGGRPPRKSCVAHTPARILRFQITIENTFSHRPNASSPNASSPNASSPGSRLSGI